MTDEGMLKLLSRPESDSLEWKADFPRELLAVPRGSDWDTGRAVLLKDLVAMANAGAAGPGHLIYGVRDAGASRVVGGTTATWDDATFQTWSENIFDPPPQFSYSEHMTSDGKHLGIFQVDRVARYPHVVKRALGNILFEGQVWFRRGTKNTVAHREELQLMFSGERPFAFDRMEDPQLKKVVEFYRKQGLEPCLPRIAERDSLLAQGYELAYFPGTRREIVVGHRGGDHYELLLMLHP